MFRESFKLGNFKKVYPLALLSTVFLFLATYFSHRSNTTDVEMTVSIVGSIFSALLFVYLYAAQNQAIGNELTAEFQEEEPLTLPEILKGWKGYALPSVGVLVVGYLLYGLIIPLIGSIAGGLFQVSVAGVEMNLLTLLMNLMVITWVVFAIVEINTLGVSFKETFSYTINFVFTNFLKVVLFLVVYLVAVYLVLVLLINTMAGNQFLLMPVKALFTAYAIAFLNVYAANLFIDNVNSDDFVEPEEDEDVVDGEA